MFTVENKLITNDKTLDIGKQRNVTLVFQFEDVEFADTDVFTLTYGDNLTSENYAFTNEGLLKFVNVPFDFITSTSTSVQLNVVKGETQILDDSITITAEVDGQDLSDYVTTTSLSTTLSDYQEKTNGLSVNETTSSSDTVELAFNDDYAIQKLNLTGEGTTLTINPITGYTAVSGKIPTFEMWITATTGKTTISVSNTITVIDDNLPQSIETTKTYVFVWRLANNTQQLNYAYSF